MEHINFGPTCFALPNGMWLLLGAILYLCTGVPAQVSPSTTAKPNVTSTISTTPHPHLSSISVEGPKQSESPNVTHSYTESSTASEGNTTDVAPNTIDDQLLEVTSSLAKTFCALCAGLEYNSTEGINITTNSTSGVLSKVTGASEESGFFNVGVIVAIAVLVIVILALIGGVGFFVYRYFAWNRPQTLTDKFSNDESTGYIDDTAFRENSEELYSLDNDSFLNSLEAMTIQNYWTDHVRHTKL